MPRDDRGASPCYATKQAQPPALAVDPPEQIFQEMLFGLRRDADFAYVNFEVVNGKFDSKEVNRTLRTSISDFQTADGRRFHNPRQQIYSQAVIGSDGESVRLMVCFDPGSGRRVLPGRYSGAVTVDDQVLAAPATIFLEVALEHPDPFGPVIVVLLAGFLAAVFYANFLDDTAPNFSQWIRRPGHYGALFFASGALIPVYIAYLHTADWGADLIGDAGKIFTSAFTAQVTSLSAYVALLKSKEQGLLKNRNAPQ